MKSNEILDLIKSQGVLPLYFHKDQEVSLEILKAVYSGGISVLEYTNRGEAAMANFKAMLQLRDEQMPDMKLGIGTIKDLDTAKKYLDLGADFIVSPGFVEEVAKYCVANDIFYAPGCMTPTEIIQAENCGIKFIKLFPGNIIGVAFMSSVKDVFQNLSFMPTGGVDPTEASMKSWFDAGVCAVGMGSKLISKQLMESKNYAQITEDVKATLEILSKLRS
jgi:2-dehydro-3-deoxyphosphogluconate aldolase / (4S)-4-hydroxy-2-oxoglutarate aldolase